MIILIQNVTLELRLIMVEYHNIFIYKGNKMDKKIINADDIIELVNWSNIEKMKLAAELLTDVAWNTNNIELSDNLIDIKSKIKELI
jgi:hypothetical protein